MDRLTKSLVRYGLAIHWLKARSKAPIGKDWAAKPVNTVESLTASHKDGYNVGVRLGKWSKTEDGYLHVLDLDIRDADRSEECWDTLRSIFPDLDIDQCPCVISGSRGESRHLYVMIDEAFTSKKLAHSDDSFTDSEGKKHWFWEIELFGTGKQVAIPPSIHPDTGKEYLWERDLDVTGGTPALDADHVADLVYGEEYEEATTEQTGITYDEAEAYLKDLDPDYWCEDREGWIKAGMALHHEFNGAKDAFDVWCEFSRQSKKFDLAVSRQQWKSFKESKRRTITFRTVIDASNEYRRADELAHIDEEFDDLPENDEPEQIYENVADEFDDLEPLYDLNQDAEIAKQLRHVPKHLLTVPGVLSDLVDYYNAASIKTQPQFAVQTALALGSVICSRNHTTPWNNYSSLYFLNIISSSSGKEMIDTVIGNMLHKAGLDSLQGPSDFTSDEALFGTLYNNGTRKISVIDEFSEFLRAVKNGNGVKMTVMRSFLTLFSKIDKAYRGKAFSLQGKTKEEVESLNKRYIKRPSLTVVGMTPPHEFTEAVSLSDASNGFLNRLIVVRSPVQFQFSRYPEKLDPPQRVIKWMKEVASAHGDEDELFDVRIGNEPTLAPEPKLLPFSKDVEKFLVEIDRKLTIEQRQLKEEKFQVIKGRTREKAIRIAMIVALSCRSDSIEMQHMQWAFDYVDYYDSEMLSWFLEDLGRGKFTRIADKLYQLIDRAGDKGLSMSKLIENCTEFRALDLDKERQEVMRRLETDFGVQLVREERKRGQRGRPTERYILPR